jgi:hypothetical protein
MFIAIIEEGVVVRTGDYRQLFPNTAFTAGGPNYEFMQENKCKYVSLFKPYDPLIEKLTSAEPYIEGDFVYMVQVTPLTEDEILVEKTYAMGILRKAREELLAKSDWTQLPDAPVDSVAWSVYRQALRDFPETVLDPRLPYTFPTAPIQ